MIAPFEGLYRRNGYEALEAMRAAIGETQVQDFALLPLALDDSIGPQRTVKKMIADPTVKAIVGPLTPQTWMLSEENIHAHHLPWLAPFAVSPEGGFADPDRENRWSTGIIEAIGNVARARGKTHLIIAGHSSSGVTLSEEALQASTDLDIKLLGAFQENLDKIADNNSVIVWLGSADEGAALANKVWSIYPNVTWWNGPQGEDPVFAERIDQQKVWYWATWSNAQYAEWAATHQPSSIAAYHTFRATQDAISSLLSARDATQIPWFVQCFQVDEQHVTLPFDCK